MGNYYLQLLISLQLIIILILSDQKSLADDFVDDEETGTWVREMCTNPIPGKELKVEDTGRNQLE